MNLGFLSEGVLDSILLLPPGFIIVMQCPMSIEAFGTSVFRQSEVTPVADAAINRGADVSDGSRLIWQGSDVAKFAKRGHNVRITSDDVLHKFALLRTGNSSTSLKFDFAESYPMRPPRAGLSKRT